MSKYTEVVRVPRKEWQILKQRYPSPDYKDRDRFFALWHSSTYGNMFEIGKPRTDIPGPRSKKSIFADKKGSFQDLPFYAVIIAAFAIFILIGAFLANTVNDKIQTAGLFPQASKDQASRATSKFTGAANSAYLFFVVGVIIAMLALAALVRIHPIFIVLFIMSMIFFLWVCAALSNAYQSMAADPVFASTANQLYFIGGIMNVLPYIVGVTGTILMVIMYKTWRAE